MKQLALKQGEAAWLQHRLYARNASDAAAVVGCHPSKTRDSLLRQHATGMAQEHSDFVEKRVFADGHAIESKLRPTAEAIIGEDLYPVVGTKMVSNDPMSSTDGIELSASFDGLTMLKTINWECKSLNDELRTALPMPGPDGNDGNNIPKYHRIQMQQQCMVAGCTKVLFTASDGKGDDRHCWFYPDPVLAGEIMAAWRQFDIDKATYVPTTITEMPKGQVTLDLPALFIHAKGEITTSNMTEYGIALDAKMKAIRSIVLVSDQDFANAKTAAAQLRDSIEKAKLAKAAMLAQTATVGETALMIDEWCENMRLTALQLEKDYEREDKAKKAKMILDAKGLYDKHIEPLHSEIAPILLTVAAPVFAEAIKNKRNFASMKDAIDTMLANAKIAADAEAKDLRAKLAWIKVAAEGKGELFRDLKDIIRKPMEDFQLVVNTRLTEQKMKDDAVAAKVITDEAARIAALAAEAAKPVVAPAPRDPEPAPAVQAAPVTSTVRPFVAPTPRLAAAVPPSLKLGQISERLGFTVTADFLKALGFDVAATDKSAKLYHEADFTHICAALVNHINRVQARQAA